MATINSRSLSVGGWASVFSVMLIVVAGCSDGRPKRVEVSGKVLLNGEPLRHGYVRVVPQNHRPAYGKINQDGTFQLTSFTALDGAVLGTHAVTVNGGESLSIYKTKWHAPKQYSVLGKSGLEITIDEPTDDLVIELTTPDGTFKPFVESVR